MSDPCQRTRCDVAVVGGGLAGLSAAMVLARRGHGVAVIEQKSYPFHRLCGEFLSPEFRVLLGAIGFDERPILARSTPVRRARFTAPGGAEVRERLPGEGAGLSRFALDQELARQAEAAGAQIVDGTRALSIAEADDATTLETDAASITCRRSILATGKIHAQWRRLAGRTSADVAGRRALLGIKLHGRIHHADDLEDVVEIHGFRGGYCGFVAIEDGKANLCLLARQSAFEPHRTPAAFLTEIARHNAALGARLARFEPVMDAPIVQSNFATGPRAESRPAALLAGDADGMISPLAGEGMCMALRAGRIAGLVMSGHLRGQYSWSEALSLYASAMRDEKLALLRVGNLLQELLFRPAACGALLRTLAAMPPLRHLAMRVTRRSDAALPSSVADL